MTAILKNLWLRNTILVIVVALFMGIVNAAAHGEFLNPRNLVTVLEQISYNCILGVGQTFVIITAGIDLSIGSLVALTGVVMAQTANHLGFGGVGLVLVTLLAGVAGPDSARAEDLTAVERETTAVLMRERYRDPAWHAGPWHDVTPDNVRAVLGGAGLSVSPGWAT